MFILDKENPKLSIIELFSYFESRNITYKLLSNSNQAAVFRLSNLDQNDFILTIASTIKFGEIVSKKSTLCQGIKKEFNYYITSYSGNKDKQFEKFLKQKFKKATHEKTQDAIEFLTYDKYVARKISNISQKEFEIRDKKKPKKKMKRPIASKLAKIMVNLSKAKQGDTLADPFAGTGTILQEALLSNCDVIGIDISRTMTASTLKNLKWLYNQYDLTQNFEMIRGDSTSISKYLTIDEVDAIVTEPFIPVFKLMLPSFEKAKKIIRDLEKLYFLFLMNAKKALKENGRVVIIVPVIITKEGKKITMNFFKIASRANFKVIEYPEEFSLPISYKKDIKKGFIREIYILE